MANRPGRMKNRRSTLLDPELETLEKSQGRCPSGHVLPNRTNRGQCTPVFCAGSTPGVSPTRKEKLPGGTVDERFSAMGSAGVEAKRRRKQVMEIVSKEADKIIDSMIPPSIPGYQQARATAKAQKSEELVRLAHSIGRYSAMRSFFQIPEGMDPAQQEAWVTARAESLTVDAVLELERQLKFGDDTQRREAYRDILEMTGKRRREAAPGANNVIHLHYHGAPNGPPPLPWRRTDVVDQQPAQPALQMGGTKPREE